MGIRGHIQTVQPSYVGGACISSWKSDHFRDFLLGKGVDLTEREATGDWEISINGELRELVKKLLVGEFNDEIDALFYDDDLKGDNAKQLGAFLQRGIEIGDEKHYDTIAVDFF